ncbi:type II toxin-antitoxin system RelB family antitoxin [Schleiferilactobacillus perolens]|uniref:type II toxin-antitoxin system RelB family antitoxin n=1 Tax=Schleiferilactobacillus perolens TaxID=100468 RepID=UPI000710A567|nr:DUF6290 family protein [Schleiferilactobacillus perolens]
MSKTVLTTLHFRDEEYNQIKVLAARHGISASEYMRQAVLDRIEDEEDYRGAVINIKASHGETVSRERIKKRLDIR